MITKLGDEQGTLIDFVNDAVLIVNPARPVPRECMFEWLWLTNAFEGLSLDFLN